MQQDKDKDKEREENGRWLISVYKQKAQFFKDYQKQVHVSLYDGRFYNGFVKEINPDFLLLVDDILGEMPIFFQEIKRLELKRDEVRRDGKFI